MTLKEFNFHESEFDKKTHLKTDQLIESTKISLSEFIRYGKRRRACMVRSNGTARFDPTIKYP